MKCGTDEEQLENARHENAGNIVRWKIRKKLV